MRRIVVNLITVLVVSQFAQQALAQQAIGRWSIGLRAGPNMWVNDYNNRKAGFSTDLSVRYSFSRAFALGATAGFSELKSVQEPTFPQVPHAYLKVNALPVSIVGRLYLSPSSAFSPFVYGGIGGMFYNRRNGDGVFVPDNAFQFSVYAPVGLGFETFTSKLVSLSFDVGYMILDDVTDFVRFGNVDAYPSIKAGVNFYFGRSDDDDEDNDDLTNGEEERLGTDPSNPDTDRDWLRDGEEVKVYKTDPLKVDTDGDGLSDGFEVLKYRTHPLNPDTDGDGLSDGDEVMKYRTNPNRPDTDEDGLLDGEEVLNFRTDPLKADTDGDGLTDLEEVRVHGTDPQKPDTDGDGLTDGEEVRVFRTNPSKIDSDGGGINDGAEVRQGTNPLDPLDDEQMMLERGKSVILEGVTFEVNSSRLTYESEKILEKVLLSLLANPDLVVDIVGHTDNVGSSQANMALSLRRAQAVKTWLIAHGIPSRRMFVIGRGDKDPIVSNDTAEGRARNRRIEFAVRE